MYVEQCFGFQLNISSIAVIISRNYFERSAYYFALSRKYEIINIFMFSKICSEHFQESTVVVLKIIVIIIIIIIIIITIILTENRFLHNVSGTTIRHYTQITHITQNNIPRSKKHSTRNYTNNKEHTRHNEYNANTSYNYNYNLIIS
jgi:amino acid transporter